jgi:hypothetical protein
MVKISKKYLAKQLTEFMNMHKVRYATRDASAKNVDTDNSGYINGDTVHVWMWKGKPERTKGVYHSVAENWDDREFPIICSLAVPFQLGKGDIIKFVD